MTGKVQIILLTTCMLYMAQTYAYRFQYTPKGGVFPEIMLDVDFKIYIEAYRGKHKVGQRTFDVSHAPRATIDGAKDLQSHMFIRFEDGIEWEFMLQERLGIVNLRRAISLAPVTAFASLAALPGENQTLSGEDDKFRFEVPGVVNAGVFTDSYQCNDERAYIYKRLDRGDSEITYKISTIERMFRIQAYALEDGTYGPGFHCQGDTNPVSTKAPPKTTTTKHKKTTSKSPPTAPTINNFHRFTVQDKDSHTCIVFQGKTKFTVTYKAVGNVDRTVELTIPGEYSVEGDCGENKQRLTINFFKDWFLTFLFEKNPDSPWPFVKKTNNENTLSDEFHDNDLVYKMSNVSLAYSNNKHTPGAIDEWQSRSMSSVPEKGAKLPQKGKGEDYFQCNDGIKMDMGRASLDLSDMKFKAFMKEDENESFNGKPGSCVADKKRAAKTKVDWTLVGYIMIGVAGFTVIVIFIAYIARRNKRMRKGYRSIDA